MQRAVVVVWHMLDAGPEQHCRLAEVAPGAFSVNLTLIVRWEDTNVRTTTGWRLFTPSRCRVGA